MRYQLQTEIVIDADQQTVWDVLTDLDSYEAWNPFVVSSEGRVEVGQRLVNRIQPPEGKAVTFKPTVTVVEPRSTFEWLGRFVLPGLFDGRHRFDLEPAPDGGTRLVHGESFRGVLVRPMRSSLDTKTKRGFELMNEALKARAESVAAARR